MRLICRNYVGGWKFFILFLGQVYICVSHFQNSSDYTCKICTFCCILNIPPNTNNIQSIIQGVKTTKVRKKKIRTKCIIPFSSVRMRECDWERYPESFSNTGNVLLLLILMFYFLNRVLKYCHSYYYVLACTNIYVYFKLILFKDQSIIISILLSVLLLFKFWGKGQVNVLGCFPFSQRYVIFSSQKSLANKD